MSRERIRQGFKEARTRKNGRSEGNSPFVIHRLFCNLEKLTNVESLKARASVQRGRPLLYYSFTSNLIHPVFPTHPFTSYPIIHPAFPTLPLIPAPSKPLLHYWPFLYNSFTTDPFHPNDETETRFSKGAIGGSKISDFIEPSYNSKKCPSKNLSWKI